MKVIIDDVEYAPIPEPPPEGVDRILELRFDSDAGDNITIREYFKKLLLTLWHEVEGFSGKRPFGNSDWDHDLYKPLIKAGVIDGEIDEDGYIQRIENERAAHAYVRLLILAA